MRELLILEPFRPEHMERIREAAGENWTIHFHPQGLPEAELKAALSTAEVVCGAPAPRLLHKTGSVKWLQLVSAGTDAYTNGGVPFPEGMRLTNASGAFGHIISQYVVAQILSIMLNLPGYHCQQQQELWNDLGPVASLEGATVLIFGTGNIGTEITERLKGFHTCNVGVCRNTSRPRPGFDRLCTMEEAADWLPKADVVIGCIPASPASHHYMNEERLSSMKPGAVLINVGRGSFIDSDALVKVLESGLLRGAAMDVTEPEPLPVGHPLWKLPNCLITPHTSGGSFGRHIGTENRICDILCENLRRWNQGEGLKNLVL